MTRVEKYGNWILVGIVLFTLVALLYGSDRLLARNAKKPDFTVPRGVMKVERTIRVREWTPQALMEVTPPDGYAECTDGLEKRPYRMKLDANGFIEPSTLHESPDVKVLFLGGSTTECLFVNEDERFAHVAGRLVEKATGKRTNAYNAGRSGNHGQHMLAILTAKGLPLRPDIAVFHEAINDLNILLYYGSYWNENPTRSLILARPKIEGPPPPRRAADQLFESLWPHLHEAIFPPPPPAGDEFADRRGKQVDYDRGAMLAAFRATERTFIDTCRAWGIQPVLMTQASRITEAEERVVTCDKKQLFASGMDYATFRDLHRAFNQVTRDLGKEQSVPVVDLEASIPQEAKYMYDTVHYSGAGSKRAGEVIAETLVQVLSGQLPLPTTPPDP